MTTHNGAATIGESIASVLRQKLSDFELIIVDDASTDATPGILHALGDSRVRLVRNAVRAGIVGARNVGLALCRAKYIAALDHDDVSDARRLGLQAAYLDAHPHVVLVGTRVRERRGARLIAEDQPPHSSPALMRLLLHLDNPLAWSSVMVRSAALQRLPPPPLREDYEPADDFDLYHRLLAEGDIARLDEPLTTYRWHAGNATYSTGAQITEGAIRVLARAYANWFGGDEAAAAKLVVRHGNERIAATDAATLKRLREVVGVVAQRLAAAQPGERRAIEAGARLVLWRLTRAAVRSGYPVLFRPPAPLFDAIVSLAVGAVRMKR